MPTALSSLRFLYLADINFRGSFDIQELDSLSNLEALVMWYNEIDNLVVRKDYRDLRKLNWGDLSGNGIKYGSKMLQSMGSFPSLKILYLWDNNFTKTMTTNQELHNFTNLEDLTLDGSSLHKAFYKALRIYFVKKLVNELLSARWCSTA